FFPGLLKVSLVPLQDFAGNGCVTKLLCRKPGLPVGISECRGTRRERFSPHRGSNRVQRRVTIEQHRDEPNEVRRAVFVEGERLPAQPTVELLCNYRIAFVDLGGPVRRRMARLCDVEESDCR